MRFTELKGEAALDALADLIDPIATLVQNDEIRRLRKSNAPTTEMAKVMLKTDKKAVLEILAIVEGEDPATYAPGPLEIMTNIVEIFNTPEIKTLFFSPEQTGAVNASDSATEDTQAEEQ